MKSKLGQMLFFVGLVVVMIGLISNASTNSAAFKSPIVTPPNHNLAKLMDQFWLDNPAKIQARSGKFSDALGDTVYTQTVVTIPHHNARIVNIKVPNVAIETAPSRVSPTVFESPLALTYTVYLPSVNLEAETHVMILIYQGQTPTTLYGGGFPVTQSMQTLNLITDGSRWGGYWNPNATPSRRYGVYGTGPIIYYTYPPTRTSNGYFNVSTIYSQNDVCDLVDDGLVDEVWILADGSHIYSPSEFSVNGPDYSIDADSMLVPNCGKTVTTMYFNFDRDVGSAVHSYGHTFDQPLTGMWLPYHYEECDFVTEHLNSWGGPVSQCTGQHTANDVYGFTARPSAAHNNSIGVCGDTHWPPNLPMSFSTEYDYSEPITATTRCNDWQWNGGTTSSVSCYSWGCISCPDPSDEYQWFLCNQQNEIKYTIWWMQHIPGLNNTSHGRNGDVRPNYWDIKFQ